MPAVRKQLPHPNAEASSSRIKSNADVKRKHRSNKEHLEPDTTPGVQKIKSALRQTRRLLAKDKLSANVRVETERRLKALEADLHKAELSNKERAFAVRYHKVKFFERQKVTRKIKQTQKRLEFCEHKSEKKRLKTKLQELRVDLNYVLHFPKLKKYISLFPPEARKGDATSTVSPAEKQKTDAEREEIRSWIRTQMKQGELPTEPETEKTSNDNPRGRSRDWPPNEKDAVNKAEDPQPIGQEIERDDFFGDDDDEVAEAGSSGDDAK